MQILKPLAAGLVPALCAAQPSYTPPSTPLVSFTIYNDICSATSMDNRNYTITETSSSSSDCIKWQEGGQWLTVQSADKNLEYNSLRVYFTKNCGGPWTLQPLDSLCSRIVPFHSIKLVLKE
ncbi:hypothetical protein CC78DRAFT_619200 [Lojkania enalia]|uniref:Uncharacterized protein n=1 Tax=Lojkania enalia TaxID=147567 RepID=A0A9P4K4K1_9PLEO|nr:hypothetical protein CC78DRAFT_619200 [Didymosphaeria enalia]